MSLYLKSKKSAFILAFGFIFSGCGSLYKGPRNSYSYSSTITNSSDYILTASVSYDDRSVEDECSNSSDTNYVDVPPGETKSVSISTMCHQEPTSSAQVTFPQDAKIDKKYYSFAANKKITCSNSGCVSD